MARAAAKRKTVPKPPAGRGPRQPRAVKKANRPVEETLFFHRIRKGTKWVFALLAVAFAFSFVVAGVGSGSTGFGSVIDALGGIFGTSGGSGGLSISKSLKRIEKNPKDATAYFDAAQAYQAKNQPAEAITYYESYSKLRPNDRRPLVALAGLYTDQFQFYSQAAQQALSSQQQPSSPLAQGFGPSSASPLGQALSDPIANAVTPTTSSQSSGVYQQFASAAQQSANNVERTYGKLVKVDPTDTSAAIQYAQAAQQAGDTSIAIAQYRKFIKTFPDDSNVAYAKQQLKTLTGKKK
jgi:tetratricopeptide (TPR) repeat protein